jgi:hypothetical protein
MMNSVQGKLKTNSLLLVNGYQHVGKTTVLLCFLDECLKRNITPWKVIAFVNPIFQTPEDLVISLDEIDVELKMELKDYDSEQILFAVDGLKRAWEDDENNAKKCCALFGWIRDHNYKLIASLRDDQKDSLERMLRKRDGNKWLFFDPEEELIEPNPEFANVKKLVISYLSYGSFKLNIRVPMTFDDPEFNECVRIIAEKSED